MLTLADINNIESDSEISELEYFKSIQRIINSGMWAMQSGHGRTMLIAIQEGLCLLGKAGSRDPFGNYIPSRDEVKEGTKGSISYVKNLMGENWLSEMQSV